MKILYQLKKYIFLSSLCLTGKIFSQANFFDAISSDTLEKHTLFFQQQVNVSEKQLQFGTVFTWGLGKNWEIGLNIHQLTFERQINSDIQIYHPEPEENPDLLINAQKIFQLRNWYHLGVGTRSGISYAEHSSECSFTTFTYLNNRISIPSTENKITFGPYYANREYAGEGTNFGLMAAVQAEIIKDKLCFLADFLSGNNPLSNFNAGLQLALPKNWNLSVGAGVPLPGTENTNNLLIQISKQ